MENISNVVGSVKGGVWKRVDKHLYSSESSEPHLVRCNHGAADYTIVIVKLSSLALGESNP
jgi:hypothetical protein